MKKLINCIDKAFWRLDPAIGTGVIIFFICILGIVVGNIINTFGMPATFLIGLGVYVLYCIVYFIIKIWQEYNKDNEKTN